jgi:predicted nucleic acid-binding protein
MNIENKIGVLINNNSEESNLSDLPMGKKIKLLFSDEVWNALDTTIDECILKPMLDQVAEQRNRFFHHRNDKTDLKLLKRVWDLLNA